MVTHNATLLRISDSHSLLACSALFEFIFYFLSQYFFDFFLAYSYGCVSLDIKFSLFYNQYGPRGGFYNVVKTQKDKCNYDGGKYPYPNGLDYRMKLVRENEFTSFKYDNFRYD
jgi:hypothetical protein